MKDDHMPTGCDPHHQRPKDIGQVQTLVRAFGILDLLATEQGPMMLKDIASSAGLARSTTHRLLTTMESLRYVQFESETKHWRVGPKIRSKRTNPKAR